MMRKVLLFAAAMALSSPAMAATNLLKNGSFEDNIDFNFWNVTLAGTPIGTAPVVIDYNSPADYPDGAFFEPIPPSNATSLSPDVVGTKTAYFSSDTGNPHSLSQIVELVAGTVYNVGFDYYVPTNGFNNENPATLQFFVEGQPVGTTFSTASLVSSDVATWKNFSTSFTAQTGGFKQLGFNFFGGGVTAADFAVERVFAVAAVPEPATWFMMLLGFGAIGFSMRRRQPALRVQFA